MEHLKLRKQKNGGTGIGGPPKGSTKWTGGTVRSVTQIASTVQSFPTVI
jgi:hypothetical protein